MLVADTLVAIGFASISLGTIQEADGVQERTFWLRNDGTEAVALLQGYTSCGCTTIHFTKDEPIAVGDSTSVVLRFNPQGKGGEFEETGTIVYGPNRKRIQLSMVGTCITSEEGGNRTMVQLYQRTGKVKADTCSDVSVVDGRSCLIEALKDLV